MTYRRHFGHPARVKMIRNAPWRAFVRRLGRPATIGDVVAFMAPKTKYLITEHMRSESVLMALFDRSDQPIFGRSFTFPLKSR